MLKKLNHKEHKERRRTFFPSIGARGLLRALCASVVNYTIIEDEKKLNHKEHKEDTK